MSDQPEIELIRRLRSLRGNYAHRAEHLPHPPLSWSDATADLDDVLAALDGQTWAERRGLIEPDCPSRCGWNDPCPDPWHDQQVTRPAGEDCCEHIDLCPNSSDVSCREQARRTATRPAEGGS